jgi:hypothetical protein
MELVPQELRAGGQGVVGRISNPSYLVLAAVLALTGGCVTTDSLVTTAADQPPTGEVSEVHVWWHNQVMFGQDPVHDGKSMPGLAARVYLTRSQMRGGPIAGDGSILVQLFDPVQKASDGQPVKLAEWGIENKALKQQLHRDGIGWGYTLLLPWETYRPDITTVLLRLRYLPPKGPAIFADPAMVTLNPVQDLKLSNAQEPTPGVSKTSTSPGLAANRQNPVAPTSATLTPINTFAPQGAARALPMTR